ncbi:autotransporter domain-containing protein [Parasphingorhabdus sp.]|uniref:autotransporter domain-containing protein n=1 Tax=Parasphingorhabdus sp. TaxID=2709688 RepID=UPI0032994A6B
MIKNFGQTKRSALLRTAAAGAIATLALATPAQAIVPNDNFTPDDIVDTDGGVNGVGMFFRNDGFVCSGTLINPRTVLFAAHCVNSNPESDFADGNINSAFSFDVNALPGFQNWIGNGFASNPDLFVYNISQIYYSADSLVDPNAFGFLEADIALAALDDPARNIPTWALLFSPLPDPGAISDEDGTGYHVNITGYGRSGSGTTGASSGIDWRRKAAENMLGSLTSFDDRNTFLFGQPFGDLPQVLYRLDFDDPNKTNPFDFNLYKDEPRANEGTTAGGDSGGPLILDAANNAITDEDIQIGVLSGGSRFFGAQVFSSYGTESFYQPLFLFHDYIAATNPYRYVSAKAGDGAWEDPTHWQTDLDPAYRIIDADGNIVNGFPDTQELGRTGDSPQFGEVCFDPEGDNPGDGCFDLATGQPTPPSRPAPTPAPTSNIGQAQVPNATPAEVAAVTPTAPVVEASAEVQATAVTSEAASAGRPTIAANAAIRGEGMIVENVAISGGATLVENIAISGGAQPIGEVAISGGATPVAVAPEANGGPEASEEQPHAPGDPQPTPTIANGLVGATDFIPENVDSDVDGILAGRRYFEVTLNQAGTTTLSSARTIDRLNVGGAAGLVINSNGSLTLENDGNQTGGRVAVDGMLNSANDYTIFSGVLSGTGTVTAPFVTSIAGAIAPGTMGTVGTLAIDGNLIAASGSTMLVDLGASGNSDLLTVTGEANIGGNVALASVAGFQTTTPSTYRILTADGGVTNQFNGVSNLSAILLSTLTYSANAVDLTVRAQSYNNVIDGNNAVQSRYAGLMNRNRGNAALAGLFSFLDFTDAATIQSTFDSWAPTTESTVQSMGQGFLGNVADFHQNRISLADRSSNGGTVAVIGRPMQLAAASLGGIAVNGASVLSDAAANADDTEVRSGGVNEDMAVYLAGGFVNGDGGSMPLRNGGAGADGEDEFDGFFIAGGLEYYLDESSFIGFSGYYSDVDATVALGNTAQARTIMGSVYGRSKTFADLVFDARVSLGTYNAKTARSVALGPQAFNLTTDDDSLIFASELGLSKELNLLDAIVAPGIRARAAKINFSNVSELGGGPALTIVRPDYASIQGLAGVEFKSKPGKKLQLRASMHYVHEFMDNPSAFSANFVGGNGGTVPFALVTPDKNWGEAGVGLRYNMGNVSIDLSADTTVGRTDVSSQVYSGAISFRF